MSQEKLKTLNKHLEKYKNRLASGLIPARQESNGDSYWAYVKREIARTEKKIESLQLAGLGKK